MHLGFAVSRRGGGLIAPAIHDADRKSAGLLGVGSVVTATLSADHRASDGHAGALFLAAIDAALQQPETL